MLNKYQNVQALVQYIYVFSLELKLLGLMDQLHGQLADQSNLNVWFGFSLPHDCPSTISADLWFANVPTSTIAGVVFLHTSGFLCKLWSSMCYTETLANALLSM